MSRVATEADRQKARRQLLTTRQVGDLLGISQEHVRQLILDRELRAMDVARDPEKAHEYRIREEWVAEFEQRRTSGPTTAA